MGRAGIDEDERPKAARARRAKIGKAEIVEAALELLHGPSHETLTFERIAEAMRVSPMSIYHHMGNRQALLDAVADHVLSTFRVDLDPASPWQQQITACIEALCGLMRETPTPLLLFMRLGVGALPGWGRVLAEFGRSLSGLSLEDDERARLLRWVTRTSVTLAISEAAFPGPLMFLGLTATITRIPDDERELLVPLLRSVAVPEAPAASVAFSARRIVHAIEGFLAEVVSPPSVGVARGSRGAA